MASPLGLLITKISSSSYTISSGIMHCIILDVVFGFLHSSNMSPFVILTLGTLPASEYANINLAKSHGVPVILENGIHLVPIFHPNYLILKPLAKRDVWTALQNMQNILKSA